MKQMLLPKENRLFVKIQYLGDKTFDWPKTFGLTYDAQCRHMGKISDPKFLPVIDD
jgi:hypothetical protein